MSAVFRTIHTAAARCRGLLERALRPLGAARAARPLQAAHRIARMKRPKARLAAALPSLSIQPFVITQIVDRKNADEWAMVLAALSCAGIAYVGFLWRRVVQQPSLAESTDGRGEDDSVEAGRLLRQAVRARTTAIVSVPLVLVGPLLLSTVMGRSNHAEWMCFFTALAVFELFQIARVLRASRSEIRAQLQRFQVILGHGTPVDREAVRERLGRRWFAALERMPWRESPETGGHRAPGSAW